MTIINADKNVKDTAGDSGFVKQIWDDICH